MPDEDPVVQLRRRYEPIVRAMLANTNQIAYTTPVTSIPGHAALRDLAAENQLKTQCVEHGRLRFQWDRAILKEKILEYIQKFARSDAFRAYDTLRLILHDNEERSYQLAVAEAAARDFDIQLSRDVAPLCGFQALSVDLTRKGRPTGKILYTPPVDPSLLVGGGAAPNSAVVGDVADMSFGLDSNAQSKLLAVLQRVSREVTLGHEMTVTDREKAFLKARLGKFGLAILDRSTNQISLKHTAKHLKTLLSELLGAFDSDRNQQEIQIPLESERMSTLVDMVVRHADRNGWAVSQTPVASHVKDMRCTVFTLRKLPPGTRPSPATLFAASNPHMTSVAALSLQHHDAYDPPRSVRRIELEADRSIHQYQSRRPDDDRVGGGGGGEGWGPARATSPLDTAAASALYKSSLDTLRRRYDPTALPCGWIVAQVRKETPPTSPRRRSRYVAPPAYCCVLVDMVSQRVFLGPGATDGDAASLADLSVDGLLNGIDDFVTRGEGSDRGSPRTQSEYSSARRDGSLSSADDETREWEELRRRERSERRARPHRRDTESRFEGSRMKREPVDHDSWI